HSAPPNRSLSRSRSTTRRQSRPIFWPVSVCYSTRRRSASPARLRRTGRGVATHEERSSAARIGAHTSWANTVDRSRRTAPARQGFMKRFEDQVDPERKLSPHERQLRAQSAMRAYMGQLSKKGKQARKK